MRERMATELMATCENRVKIVGGEETTHRSVLPHQAQGDVVRPTQIMGLENSAAGFQSRSWKVIKGERDQRGRIPHCGRPAGAKP